MFHASEFRCKRQQKLIGFAEFVTSNWWMISVDMLVASIVERCFRLGSNYFIPLSKLNYCTNLGQPKVNMPFTS